MPPSRRKPSNTTARAQQTLAFGPHSNKVTKPSQPAAAAAAAGKKKQPSLPPTDSDRLQKAVADISTPSPGPEENEYPPRPEEQLESPRALAIRGQGAAAKVEADVKSEIEEKGSRVSDAQVKRYWKSKEDERIAPRVHQRGLSVNEKILRHFDLSSQYGVSQTPVFAGLLHITLFCEKGQMLKALRNTALYRYPPHEAVEASGRFGA